MGYVFAGMISIIVTHFFYGHCMMCEEEKKAEKEAKKRKSPNKSGVVQADAATGEVIAEFATQKEALAAIGKEGKSGIGDALNARNKTHIAYGFKWYFKDEYDKFLTEQKSK